MAVYQVDQFEPVTLIRGVTQTREIKVYDGITELTVDNTTTTYVLKNAAGVTQVSGVTTSGAVSVAVPADLAIGVGAYEVWTPYVSSGTAVGPIRRSVLVTTSAMVHSPITNRAVIIGHAGWDTYPSGSTSWASQIRAGWARILRWLMTQSALAAGHELHDPGVLTQAALYAARAEVALYMATHGEESSMAWHKHYTNLLADELESLVVRYDSDGDGIADDEHRILSEDAPGFPPVGPAGRR